MKSLTNSLSFVLILGFIVSSTAGCSFKIAENYDAEVSSSIIKVAKTTDAFLLNMMVGSSVTDGSRAFDNYAGGYAAVENELISLRLQNQVRPLNATAYEITEIALKKWLEYSDTHKQNNTLSDDLLGEMRISMQDAFRAILIADEGEKYLKLH